MAQTPCRLNANWLIAVLLCSMHRCTIPHGFFHHEGREGHVSDICDSKLHDLRVLLYFRICARHANLFALETLGFGFSSRQAAKNAKFGKVFFTLRLCDFAGDIPTYLRCSELIGARSPD